MFLASLSKGFWVSLVARLVKNPPARRETWVQSLGWEDCSGERKDYLLQYSGLENSMDCLPWSRKEWDIVRWKEKSFIFQTSSVFFISKEVLAFFECLSLFV